MNSKELVFTLRFGTARLPPNHKLNRLFNSWKGSVKIRRQTGRTLFVGQERAPRQSSRPPNSQSNPRYVPFHLGKVLTHPQTQDVRLVDVIVVV